MGDKRRKVAQTQRAEKKRTSKKKRALGAAAGAALASGSLLASGAVGAGASSISGRQFVQFDVSQVTQEKTISNQPFVDFQLRDIVAEPSSSSGSTGLLVYQGKLYAQPSPPARGADPAFAVGEFFKLSGSETWQFKGQWASNQPVPDPTNHVWSFEGQPEGGSGG